MEQGPLCCGENLIWLKEQTETRVILLHELASKFWRSLSAAMHLRRSYLEKRNLRGFSDEMLKTHLL